MRENNVIICSRAVASIRWVELPVSCSYTGTWDRPESRDLRTRRLVHGTSGAPRDSWAAVLVSPQSNNPCNNQIILHCIITVLDLWVRLEWCGCIKIIKALRICIFVCTFTCIGSKQDIVSCSFIETNNIFCFTISGF